MQMIGSRKELGFQMHMFQNLESLKKFAVQKSIQVLLIGKEYLAEERMQIPAAEKFVLVKEEGRILEDEEKRTLQVSVSGSDSDKSTGNFVELLEHIAKGKRKRQEAA